MPISENSYFGMLERELDLTPLQIAQRRVSKVLDESLQPREIAKDLTEQARYNYENPRNRILAVNL